MSFYMAKLSKAADLNVPVYQTPGSSGMDLQACIEGEMVLKGQERKLVDTGIKIAIPLGYEAVIRPRSGLAIHHGITVLNSPGTIDSDYRGEIKIILYNSSQDAYTLKRGERIAQMVIQKIETIDFTFVSENELDETMRGSGGFGHTGKV